MSQIIGKFSADSYAFQATAPAQNWIGGEWQDAASGETLEVLNPRYGRAMSQVHLSGVEDVERAVEAACAG
jgi:malonate-semialdehyde dehydrogenase (acetylating) / methylmalonate-semialdehyde dehydrogenase